MKKRHGLPVPERTEAAPDQRVKWLRAIRIGLCLALGCSLTLMLIFTFMILGQEYYFAKLEAEGMLVFRAHPHTVLYCDDPVVRTFDHADQPASYFPGELAGMDTAADGKGDQAETDLRSGSGEI